MDKQSVSYFCQAISVTMVNNTVLIKDHGGRVFVMVGVCIPVLLTMVRWPCNVSVW